MLRSCPAFFIPSQSQPMPPGERTTLLAWPAPLWEDSWAPGTHTPHPPCAAGTPGTPGHTPYTPGHTYSMYPRTHPIFPRTHIPMYPGIHPMCPRTHPIYPTPTKYSRTHPMPPTLHIVRGAMLTVSPQTHSQAPQFKKSPFLHRGGQLAAEKQVSRTSCDETGSSVRGWGRGAEAPRLQAGVQGVEGGPQRGHTACQGGVADLLRSLWLPHGQTPW